jgi:ribosomal protein S18 acetylase RimI-like enzyme
MLTNKIDRMGSSDAAVWRLAVETIIAADDRENKLLTTTESADALADTRCYAFLASTGGAPIGLLTAYRFPDLESGGSLVYLYDIEVLSTHRKHGVGRALLECLIESCEHDQVKLIWAGTEAENTAARAAFEATDAELEGESYVEYEWDLEDDE